MLFMTIFIVALVIILILERYMLQAEQKRQRNLASREYYAQVHAFTSSMEEEINALKVYRHDLTRYIRILQKLAEDTESEAAEKYLHILQSEADKLQDIDLDLQGEGGAEAVLSYIPEKTEQMERDQA